jgi:hypothetical protein
MPSAKSDLATGFAAFLIFIASDFRELVGGALLMMFCLYRFGVLPSAVCSKPRSMCFD